MNLLLILVAMLSSLSGAMAGARAVEPAGVEHSQPPAAAALEQCAATRIAAAHRVLDHPLPGLAELARVAPALPAVPAASIRMLTGVARE